MNQPLLHLREKSTEKKYPWMKDEVKKLAEIRRTFVKYLTSLLAVTSMGLSPIYAEEKTALELSTLTTTSWEKAGVKSSLDFTANKVNFYLTHGDDPRVWYENFTSGGVSLTNENISLAARWFLVDDKKFGEMYTKLTGKLDCLQGAETWLRVGITAPVWVNLSSGTHINLTEKDLFFFLYSHQEAFSDGPQGTLLKAQLSHDFGNGISIYSSLDYLDGDDSSFPWSNLIMKNSPAFERYGLHGQGTTWNIGAKYTGKNTTVHLKASYNQGEYWMFTSELSQELSGNITLSGGILIDTRDAANTTGYVGVKWKF